MNSPPEKFHYPERTPDEEQQPSVLPSLKGCLMAFAGLAGVVVALITSGLFWLGHGMCGNCVSQQFLSPNKTLKAVVFVRDCGATTGFSTQVSILNSIGTSLPNEAGNAFVQSEHEPGDIVVRWLDDAHLEITYSDASQLKIPDALVTIMNLGVPPLKFVTVTYVPRKPGSGAVIQPEE